MKTLVSILTALALSVGLAAQVPVASSGSGSTVLCRTTTNIANTGSTTANAVYQCTIPAGTLGLNSQLQLHAFWTAASNSSSCTVAFRFGSAGLVTDTPIIYDGSLPTTATNNMVGWIVERNATNAQVYGGFSVRGTTASLQNPVGVGTTALSTASAMYLTLTIQNLSAADTCSLNEADVTLWP